MAGPGLGLRPRPCQSSDTGSVSGERRYGCGASESTAEAGWFVSWAQGVGRGACEAPMAGLSSAGASCPLTCVPRSQVPESPWKSLPTLVLVLLKCLFHFQLHFTQSTMQQFAGRPWVTQLLLFLCGSLLSLPETPSEKRRGLQLGDTAPEQSRAAGACPQIPAGVGQGSDRRESPS